MGAGIVRVKRDGLAEKIERLGQIVSRQTSPPIVAQQDQIVCGHIRGMFALGNFTAGLLDPSRQRRNNGSGKLILNGEDFLKFTVVAFAPEVIAAGNINELYR